MVSSCFRTMAFACAKQVRTPLKALVVLRWKWLNDALRSGRSRRTGIRYRGRCQRHSDPTTLRRRTQQKLQPARAAEAPSSQQSALQASSRRFSAPRTGRQLLRLCTGMDAVAVTAGLLVSGGLPRLRQLKGRPNGRPFVCSVWSALASRTPGATHNCRCCDSPSRSADDRSGGPGDHRAGSCPDSGTANALFRCIAARGEG